MATDFNKQQIASAGSFRPTIANVPLDIRTRIATYENYTTVPRPFVGMLLYVEDEDSYYEVDAVRDEFDIESGNTVQKIDSMKNIALSSINNPIDIRNNKNEYYLRDELDKVLTKITNRINSAGNIIEGIKFAKFFLKSDNENNLYLDGVIGIQHPIGSTSRCQISINENNSFILNVDGMPQYLPESSLHTIFECNNILLASRASDVKNIECTVTVTINGHNYIRLIVV